MEPDLRATVERANNRSDSPAGAILLHAGVRSKRGYKGSLIRRSNHLNSRAGSRCDGGLCSMKARSEPNADVLEPLAADIGPGRPAEAARIFDNANVTPKRNCAR
jgi:hypothetical protein